MGVVGIDESKVSRLNIGVKGSPERGYVVPGCGRGRDLDRTLVVMSRRRRRRRPWGGRGRVKKRL